MDEKTMLAWAKLGAQFILDAPPESWPLLAPAWGIEIEPGEDLLSAIARTKGVSRDHMEAYFVALATGNGIVESHMLALPVEGSVQ